MSRSGKGRGRTWSGGPGGSDRWLCRRRTTPATLQPTRLAQPRRPRAGGNPGAAAIRRQEVVTSTAFSPEPITASPRACAPSHGRPAREQRAPPKADPAVLSPVKPPRPGASACRADHGRILGWHLWPLPRRLFRVLHRAERSGVIYGVGEIPFPPRPDTARIP